MSLAAVLVLLLSGAVEVEYDEEGNWAGPVPCPARMPGGTWLWIPRTFHVPKFGLPAGDEVPFTVTSVTKLSEPFLGMAWYKPSPTTTTHQQVPWSWEAMTGDPAVLYGCYEVHWLFGLFIESLATWQGELIGHAWNPNFPSGGGSGTRPAGGSIAGEVICFEYFEYWYDQFGTYHEQVLAVWCEQIGGGES
jgi:hypothetical protein